MTAVVGMEFLNAYAYNMSADRQLNTAAQAHGNCAGASGRPYWRILSYRVAVKESTGDCC